MKTFAPNYYTQFQCIANQCKHSCCIGWEIDIDDDTFEYYQSINSPFGEKIKENIITQDGCNCFKLSQNERCPFLNENNLCDIILNLGEDALCQICTDHPRFRNYYSDRIEVGLGLCCEEAGRLILSNNAFSIIEIENDGYNDEIFEEDSAFLLWRDSIFKDFSNKSIDIKNRIGIQNEIIYSKEILSKYLTLEILDNSWKLIIEELIEAYDDIKDIVIPKEFGNCFEQLLLYFAYRHLPLLLDSKSEDNILNFIKTSVSVIYRLCQLHIKKNNNLSIDDIIEYSRMYSSEVEYSQENLDELI